MKIRIIGLVVLFAVAASAQALTPTLDGTLAEWGAPDVVNLGTEAAPDGGSYGLLAAWDASNLYLGVDRDSSDRYLGDTANDNDSLFVAIDVDGIAGSGMAQDGYARMDFGGDMLPDVFYAFAGGAGWYEWASWNGSSLDWQGWSDAGTYYGWNDDPGDFHPDDELSIPLANIGGSADVMVWAWMTRESNGYVEASWPTGATGDDPNPVMGNGIMLPEPASLMLLAGGLLGLARRRR